MASEERLRSFRDERTGSNLGSYLVRESDRKPGSYVLSYLGKTGINHFRVTAVCGDFYIGGRQFDSLQVWSLKLKACFSLTLHSLVHQLRSYRETRTLCQIQGYCQL